MYQQDLSWGWFSDREMRQQDLTPEQNAKISQQWESVMDKAKTFGGLQAYGDYLLQQEQQAKDDFCKVIETIIPCLTDEYSWCIQGWELIGSDEYGNQSVIVCFRWLQKQLAKGVSLLDAINKEIASQDYEGEE